MTHKPITADELAAWINTIYARNDVGNGVEDWTQLLGSCLKEEAAARGFHAWGNHIGPGRGEYLIDYCWSVGTETEKNWKEYTGLSLAAEIEWGGTKEAVWEDFVKLIDIRSESRLFVGNLWPAEWCRVDQLVQDMAEFLANHRHAATGDWVVVVLSKKSSTEDHRIWKLSRNATPRPRGDVCEWRADERTAEGLWGPLT